MNPLPRSTWDAVVIGGGIIGCAIARQLAHQSKRVLLLERAQPGAGASSAAAGMVAPQAEAECPSPLLEMALQSHRLYPDWVENLERESGLGVEYAVPGLLHLAATPEDEENLEARRQWQCRHGLAVEWLERRQIDAIATGLAPGLRRGLLFPREGVVEPVRLMRAAVQAARAAGVEVRAGVEVTGLLVASGRIGGVRSGDLQVEAGTTILAAGCWSESLAVGAEVVLPSTAPVRGQMLALEPVVRCTSLPLAGMGGYLVPRQSGHLLAGSTMENAGFHPTATTAGVESILARAHSLVPSLAGARLVKTWAGLRPGSPDGLPSIGWSGRPGLLVATGHLRNGILLAPITAALVGDLVAGLPPRLSLEDFSPLRQLRVHA